MAEIAQNQGLVDERVREKMHQSPEDFYKPSSLTPEADWRVMFPRKSPSNDADPAFRGSTPQEIADFNAGGANGSGVKTQNTDGTSTVAGQYGTASTVPPAAAPAPQVASATQGVSPTGARNDINSRGVAIPGAQQSYQPTAPAGSTTAVGSTPDSSASSLAMSDTDWKPIGPFPRPDPSATGGVAPSSGASGSAAGAVDPTNPNGLDADNGVRWQSGSNSIVTPFTAGPDGSDSSTPATPGGFPRRPRPRKQSAVLDPDENAFA